MENLNSFQFLLSTKIIFGKDQLDSLKSQLAEINARKIMIVTDKGLIKAGIVDKVLDIITENNIDYYLYDEVIPNPTINVVDEAATKCKNENCNVLIVIGGGSAMDTTKGISVMATNEGSSYEYLDGRGDSKKEIVNDPLPIIAIPTTSGTGSEVSFYSVLTDPETKIKDSITSYKIYPITAIIDPVLTKNLPPFITACTGLDVLGHALEAYTSTIENPMTDLFALEAIKIVFNSLVDAVNSGEIEARVNMSYASMLAGIAMSHCGATIPHALGCPLTGHCGMPHGLAVGILQIPMLEFNKEQLQDKIKNILKYMDVDITKIDKGQYHKHLINKIEELMKQINIDEAVKQYEMDEKSIDLMSKDAIIHGCTLINPKKISLEDIINIYNQIG
ncbi:iron-containing alcohol dehydrogenase [Vallitalea sediminicola]